MAVKQRFVVRRGSGDRYEALRGTFGAAPISASVTWDRRQVDRRRRARVSPSERRRVERRGAEPGTWSALDFLVTGAAGAAPAVDGTASEQVPTKPVDGDLLVLRETSVNGPCSVSTVPGPAHVLLPSYTEAVAYARRLADRSGAAVWYTEDHSVFTSVRRARDPHGDAMTGLTASEPDRR